MSELRIAGFRLAVDSRPRGCTELGERRPEMAWAAREKIWRGVLNMLEVNLAVREGESVLVMTDPPTLAQWTELPVEQIEEAIERCVLARLVADLAAEAMPGAKTTFLPYPSTGRFGSELDPETAEKMRNSDVVVAINNYSLTHTRAAQEACRAGARVASMPRFLAEMFEGPMTADYHKVAEDSRRMAELLTDASSALLTTPSGTHLTMDLTGRSGDVDSGFVAEMERPINLPGGEAFIVPVEGKAEGTVTVTPRGYSPLNEIMTLRFQAGEVIDIEGGGAVGDQYRQLLELPTLGLQPGRRNLAELGIGTNPKAKSVKTTLEAEKIMGTVHIAIGDNTVMGGTVQADLHQDFVLWEPSLYLDDRLVIEKGEWLV
jgi:leucyl aminopeptidase (aminopeptidase T)